MIKRENNDFITLCANEIKNSTIDIERLRDLLASRGLEKEAFGRIIEKLNFQPRGLVNFLDLQTKLKSATINSHLLTEEEAVNIFIEKTRMFEEVDADKHNEVAWQIQQLLNHRATTFSSYFDFPNLQTTLPQNSVIDLIGKLGVNRGMKLVSLMDDCSRRGDLVDLERLNMFITKSHSTRQKEIIGFGGKSVETPEVASKKIIDEIKKLIFSQARDVVRLFENID
jgi:hypothetical protein